MQRIDCHGTAREMGRQYGEAARDGIRRNLDVWLNRAGPDPASEFVAASRAVLAARAPEVLDELDVQHFPLCSLAKREEEIYLPGIPLPVRLDRRNEGLKLLQQVRDEAHRFGIAYHRNLRGKRMKKSALRDIPGIGPAIEKALLQKFGSLAKIKEATAEELQEVAGITKTLAKTIYFSFKQKISSDE